MANYEKQVEQEAAYPIPISLYNCYRRVRHEKLYNILLIAFLMPHCPVTVVQRYYAASCSSIPVYNHALAHIRRRRLGGGGQGGSGQHDYGARKVPRGKEDDAFPSRFTAPAGISSG